MAQLIVSRDRAEIDRYDLTDTVVVGRSRECGLVIDDAKVSREHCRVERLTDGGWRIVDLGSRNGLIYKGQPVAEHTLRDGDRIWLGKHVRLQFVDTVQAPAIQSPRRLRPSDPIEALRLAGVSVAATAVGDPTGPAPQSWDGSASAPTGADDAPTPSTGLSFGKRIRPARPPTPGAS